MIIARDVPLMALKSAVFKAIKEKQSMAVHGLVPPKAAFPYITIDAVMAKPADTKVDVLWNVTTTVNIWATEEQQAQVYEAINDITTIFSHYGTALDLGTAYKVLDCNIELAEVFPEQTTGFHGTMQLSFLLERKS